MRSCLSIPYLEREHIIWHSSLEFYERQGHHVAGLTGVEDGACNLEGSVVDLDPGAGSRLPAPRRSGHDCACFIACLLRYWSSSLRVLAETVTRTKDSAQRGALLVGALSSHIRRSTRQRAVLQRQTDD